MVLEASESEGYSVFVLRSLDGGIGVLPECQAEMVALDLGEPQGRMGGSTGGMSGGTSTRECCCSWITKRRLTISPDNRQAGSDQNC